MIERGCEWHSKNRKEAEKWYDMAATKASHSDDDNVNNARYRLGRMYEEDEAFDKAEELYKRPFRHSGCGCGLGRIYEHRGREYLDKAMKKYEEVAEHGDNVSGHRCYALYQLGVMYEKLGGEGVRSPGDRKSARGKVPEDPEASYRKAVSCYRTAAESLEDDTQPRVADKKRNGVHDSPLASWVEEVTRKEDDERRLGSCADAQYALGRMYEDGRGVGKDETKAREWMEKAGMHGHKKAREWLERQRG